MKRLAPPPVGCIGAYLLELNYRHGQLSLNLGKGFSSHRIAFRLWHGCLPPVASDLVLVYAPILAQSPCIFQSLPRTSRHV